MSQIIQTLDISWGTILKIAFASFCFYITYLIRDILVWSLFALIISVLFEPAIDFLIRKKVPRSLAVSLIYVSAFGILALAIYWIFPILFVETKQFSQLFPQYFEKISPPLRSLGLEAFESMESFITFLGGFLEKASSSVLNALSVVFGGFSSTIFITSISFFISLEERGIDRFLGIFTPKKYEKYVLDLWERCQIKTAKWFAARILTGFFVSLLVLIALKVFNVKYSFTLAFLAGVLEIVPILGPMISAFTAFMLVALDSWLKALFVLGAYILIQQIEGNIVTPLLTKKLVGLPPAVVLISLAVGGKLLGLLGAILAIPITGILFEFWKDFLMARKEEKIKL
ncbi:MAG: AI-2E family transporter [Patescibacteria group bacterium]